MFCIFTRGFHVAPKTAVVFDYAEDHHVMSLAHLTLPTQHVDKTAAFFETTLGYARNPVPGNSPVEALWLDIGRGQEMHVFYVEGFEVSAFESEFGRHVAVFYPLLGFPALKERLTASGATLIEPLRTTPFQRFFFREPVNGYVFEVVDEARLASA
jgi:catechol 2,3-dioxygenase-like lactoylglutathione lyase family enzyme